MAEGVHNGRKEQRQLQSVLDILRSVLSCCLNTSVVSE